MPGPITLLTGARVLSPDALSAPFADVLVEDGRIAAILPPGSTVERAQRHDASKRLVIPGLVNGHTHGHGGLAKGAGDKWDLPLLLAHAPQAGTDEVPDPYYGALSGFDLALDLIEPACDGLLTEIRRRLSLAR